MGAVEGTGEILRNGAAEGSPRVDADTQDIHGVGRGEVRRVQGRGDGGVLDHRHREEIRTFVLQTQETVMAKVGCVGPLFEIGGGVDANDEFLGVGNDHHPLLGRGIPDHLNRQRVFSSDCIV